MRRRCAISMVQRSPASTGGGVSVKRALAHELRSAGLMAYPCTLKETFCTAVAEAQAAGLPVVTSDRAALAERVTNGVEGFVIPRHAREHRSQEGFVKAGGRLLQDG